MSILVVGVNDAADHADRSAEIVKLHRAAVDLFDDRLEGALTLVGHNFNQSYFVHPNGSGKDLQPQVAHTAAVPTFLSTLERANQGIACVGLKDDDAVWKIKHVS